jgi:UDP-glucuronate 4-epimerase
MKRILITGAAGFIGSKLAAVLLGRGDSVVGVDNFSEATDASLKRARVKSIISGPASVMPGFAPASLIRNLDITDKPAFDALFAQEGFDTVVHLAAQAGVRYSVDHPYECLQNNVTGFLNVLEACRSHDVKQLVFASSSSVYGADARTPFSEEERADRPVSLYAATKRADELMAHAYSQLYGLRVTGLRFFTVYGPWGRPDMAPMLFARAIMAGEPIEVFNGGDMLRDFTYIDDVVEGIVRVIDQPAAAPYAIYNIGAGQPVKLMDFISELEEALGRKAVKRFLPMQPGDVPATHADTTAFARAFGFTPQVPLHEGLRKFAEWYKAYYK